MNVIEITVIILIFLTTLYLNKFMVRNEFKYINILVFIVSICVSKTISLNYTEFLFGENLRIYIPISLFIIISIFISTLNIKSIKITLDNIIMIIVFIHLYITYESGLINNLSKFVTVCILYINIFLIGYIFKNIQGYDYNKILKFFNYFAIFNGVLGIMQFITGKKLLVGAFNESILYGSQQVRRVVGFAGTSNSGGNLSAILFSIVFFGYLKERKKINLISLIFTVIFAILTLTRIGYLAIVIEVTLYFIISKWNDLKNIKRKLKLLLVSITLGLIGLVLWGNKIYQLLFVIRGNTTQWRTMQFDDLFTLIIPYNGFFNGIGAGQYRYHALYNLGYSDIDIHSQYLNILVEQGEGIFILFIIFNIYILKCALKKAEILLEKAFIISLFVGNLICCNYNPNQYYLLNNCIYYILMYCFVYKKNKNFETKEI